MDDPYAGEQVLVFCPTLLPFSRVESAHRANRSLELLIFPRVTWRRMDDAERGRTSAEEINHSWLIDNGRAADLGCDVVDLTKLVLKKRESLDFFVAPIRYQV